jgi:hypothetical protein
MTLNCQHVGSESIPVPMGTSTTGRPRVTSPGPEAQAVAKVYDPARVPQVI